MIALKFKEPSGGPAGRPIDVRLQGEDLDRLRLASLEVQGFLASYRGVTDLSDDLRPGKPTVRLRLREGAVGLGLTAAGVASQLRSAFFGATAATPQVGPESYEVDVRLAPSDRDALGDLEAFRIVLPSGAQVPLQAVAHVERERGWARIARVDGVRTVSVQGEVDTSQGNTSEIMAALVRDHLPGLAERYPGVRVSLEGEVKEGGTTARSLQFAFGLGLIGVFLILSFQFRSYLEPLLVMGAIPLALIGVIWGHVLLGLDLSMPSVVGFVSLAGVVVNDSILLLLFLRSALARGQEIEAACAQASRDRFRAILLTSVTTVAGLTPLLLERSSQAQVLIPLAASIVFGMLASTVLVLVVIPCGYGVLHDLGLTRDPREDDDADEASSDVPTPALDEALAPAPDEAPLPDEAPVPVPRSGEPAAEVASDPIEEPPAEEPPAEEPPAEEPPAEEPPVEEPPVEEPPAEEPAAGAADDAVEEPGPEAPSDPPDESASPRPPLSGEEK